MLNMRFSNLLLLLAATCNATPLEQRATPLLRNIFTFPNNTFIENIAARSNGKLLVTSMSVPTLFSIDPSVSPATAAVIHTFPNNTGLIGVAESTPDVFAVTSGVVDLVNTRVALGSLNVWTIDMSCTPPTVKHIANVLNTTLLNGLTTIPGNPNILLAADSAIGAVWKVNLLTGVYSVAFSDPLFNVTSTGHLGINGLLAEGQYLYFTNSAQAIFGRVKIDNSGNKLAPVEIISTVPSPEITYDDIDRDAAGNTWIASHPTHVVKVAAGGSQVVVANATLLKNPTSAVFGRGSKKEKKTLYVTNGGEFDINAAGELVLFNEGVVALDTTQV